MTDYPPCEHPYEGWFVNSVPLSRHGFLLSQFVESLPPRRGENVVIARRPGARHQQKYYASRVQTLVLWALKADEFGNLVGGSDRNVDRLKALLGGGVEQVELTRRIQLPFGRVSTRTAMVELVDVLEGQRTALTGTGTYVQFAVDLLFADPYWRESENVLEAQEGTFVLWNPGTVKHRDVVIRIYGPAVDPEIAVEPSGTVVRYSGTIDYGDFVEIDSENYTAVDDAGVSVAGLIEREQEPFVEFTPERNEITLSDGTCDVRWRPAFL